MMPMVEQRQIQTQSVVPLTPEPPASQTSQEEPEQEVWSGSITDLESFEIPDFGFEDELVVQNPSVTKFWVDPADDILPGMLNTTWQSREMTDVW
jgi:hypothetical protein